MEGSGAGIGPEVRKLEEGLHRCWERGCTGVGRGVAQVLGEGVDGGMGLMAESGWVVGVNQRVGWSMKRGRVCCRVGNIINLLL